MHQHEPSRVGLILQEELDYVRYCIISAFVIAFPKDFRKEDLMIDYGGINEQTAWSIFERKLSTHFYSYHRMSEYDAMKVLYQYRPLLPDDDSMVGTASPTSNIFTDTQYSGFQTADSEFEEVYVARCDDEGHIIESREAFLKRAFVFFLPSIEHYQERNAELLEFMKNRVETWMKERNSAQDLIKWYDTSDICLYCFLILEPDPGSIINVQKRRVSQNIF